MRYTGSAVRPQPEDRVFVNFPVESGTGETPGEGIKQLSR